jgi:hypothetical protein
MSIAFIVMEFLFTVTANTQTLIPFSGSNSVACGTNTTLCTHTGCGITYGNGASGYTVLNAKGSAVITISGSYYTESGYDYVRIYSGVGTGTLLVTYAGNSTFSYTGTAGQTLTVGFTSDGSVTYTGLNATVTYTGVCACSNFNSNYPGGTMTTTSSSWQTISTVQYAGEYSFYQVEKDAVYEWTTCQSDGNCVAGGTCLYVTDVSLWNQGGTTLLKSNTTCGSQSKINWTATSDATVRFFISGASCSTNTISTTTLWRMVSCPSPQGGTSTPTSSVLYLNDVNYTTVSLSSQYGTISYWERKDPGSSTWTNISNAGATSFNTGALLSGTYKFRAAIVKCGVTAYSSESSVQVINNLPIQLIEFKGVCDNGINKISWVTVSETNNDYFTLEKSNDGINWSILAKVNGIGNSVLLNTYTVIDSKPFDVSYYKLSQTDFNGQSETFNTILIKCDVDILTKNIIVYPNPTNSVIRLSLSNITDNDLTVKIYDIENKLVKQIYCYIPETINNTVIIKINDLSSGIYFLNVSTENYIKIIKVIKID